MDAQGMAKEKGVVGGAMCAQCKVRRPISDLKTCTGCRRVNFCNTECQAIHWRAGGHKKVCARIAAPLPPVAEAEDLDTVCPICYSEPADGIDSRLCLACCKRVCGHCFLSIRRVGRTLPCPMCRADYLDPSEYTDAIIDALDKPGSTRYEYVVIAHASIVMSTDAEQIEYLSGIYTPAYPVIAYQIGCLFESTNPDRAIEWLLKSTRPEAWNKLGEIYMDAKLYQQSYDNFIRTARLRNPFGASMVLLLLSHFPDGIPAEDGRLVLDVMKEDADRNRLTSAYTYGVAILNADPEESLKYLLQASSIPESWSYIAMLYFGKGDYATAKKYYKKAYNETGSGESAYGVASMSGLMRTDDRDEWMELAFKAGHAIAGIIIAKSWMSKGEPVQARPYLEPGLSKRVPEAVFLYAVSKTGKDYTKMFPPDYDVPRFISDITEAIEGGCYKGHAILGTLYEYGSRGFPVDKSKAIEHYRAGATKNDPIAMHSLERLIGDDTFSLAMYEKAVSNGCADANYNIGLLKEKNGESGIAYYEKAAKNGYHPALVVLGDRYTKEEDEKLNKIGVRYYKRARSFGPALMGLGSCSRNGCGMPQSDRLSYEYYRKASVECLEARVVVAHYTFCGYGVEKNVEAAEAIYLQQDVVNTYDVQFMLSLIEAKRGNVEKYKAYRKHCKEYNDSKVATFMYCLMGSPKNWANVIETIMKPVCIEDEMRIRALVCD